jgi:hypothetical protein
MRLVIQVWISMLSIVHSTKFMHLAFLIADGACMQLFEGESYARAAKKVTARCGG